MNSKIIIKKADITSLTMDAIVNAANDRLAAGGGVCGAIFKAAGYTELQDACDKIGGCKTGLAAITPGFKLSAKYIIHAVGPVYKDGKSGEGRQLESCYKESLRLAKKNGLHSVAFPLISAGIFGYPKKEAFEIAIKAVSEWQADHSDYKLDVVFAVRDDAIYALGTNVLEGEAAKAGHNPDKFVFFWKLTHKNEEFSNWYEAPFTIEGITYSCVEQYMMAKKALMFKDLEIYACIMNCADPHQIKSLGKLVKNFKSDIWDSSKDQVVYNACYAKFSQNPALKKLLISTGDKTLAEASPEDHIWGIGLTKDDPDAVNPAKWQGENRLGTILAEVRKQLSNSVDK